ncbi:MAG: hypothetical protein IKW64_03295 [Clostridia bacterium]|nr:hypothetical protein [Clostridia bacterium]
MKEQIYTIPINEALEADCDCPFCYLYKKLEQDAVDYTLGPAMMEPDFRVITNEKGFCKIHIKQLTEKRNALSLALIMDTHIDTLKSLFEFKNDGKTFLKKQKQKDVFVSRLTGVVKECAVCSRINHTLSRYYYTFIFMLKKEKGFLDKVLSGNGFCIEHFCGLSEAAASELSDKSFKKLFEPIIEIQKNKLEQHHTYIKKFADSFDYRNAGKPMDAPKDTLTKTAKLLNGEFYNFLNKD